jgi:osmotically-inducible protein OsmY
MAALLAFTSACTSGTEGGTTDDVIRSGVETALYAGNVQGVVVTVENGVVTLGGPVADQATADRAVELARTVEGVTDVRSQFAIAGVGAPGGPVEPPPVVDVGNSDSLATAQIGQRLIAEPALAGSKITPSVAGGVATLSGTVPNDGAKGEAERVAKAVPGVKSVTNNLQVVAAAVETRSDVQVEDDVSALLDKQFADLSLFVEVEEGNVSLSGAVPDQGRIVQVSKAVYGVKGVKSVDTARLTVKGGEPEGKKIGAPSN